jgi:hypothetical protein
MNISQHAFVPYSDYVQGYYNSSKVLTGTNQVKLRSNRLMSGIIANSFYQFSMPQYSTQSSNYATLRMYDPYNYDYATAEVVYLPLGELFSTSRSIQSVPLDVRVVGWYDPDAVALQALGLNRLGDGLTIQEDELI